MGRSNRGYQNNLLSNGTPGKNRTPDHLVQSQFVECPDHCPIKAAVRRLNSETWTLLAGDLRVYNWLGSSSLLDEQSNLAAAAILTDFLAE